MALKSESRVTIVWRADLAVKDVPSLMPGLLKQLQRRVFAFPSVAGAHCAVAVLQLGIGQVPDQRYALPAGQACIIRPKVGDEDCKHHKTLCQNKSVFMPL